MILNNLSMAFSGVTRDTIETTHMATSVTKTFIGGDLYDPGTLEVEFQVPTDSPLTNMKVEDIMVVSTSTFTVTLTEGGDWAGSGFMTDFNWNIPLEDVVTGSFTLKITGAVTTTN